VLVGDGPDRAELEDARAQLGLTQLVDLVGAAAQIDVLRWWQRATVAVLPSVREGMPVCLMEAAACAVPAVATAVGGVPELIEEGVTGFVVPPGDAFALAAALERLLTNPGLAAELGRAARTRAERRFTVGRQADQLLDLWEQIAA
jgi:colanic acid/amylovoran biosynthesis glycosyltransferase